MAHRVVSEHQNKLVTIGIFSQPASDYMKSQYYNPAELWSYVAGSYVDWVSSSAAMPVLIPFDLTEEKLAFLLDRLDGVLLPGGGSPLKKREDESKTTAFQDTSNFIIEFAKKRNDQGRYFPIIATCLGFESMIISFANSTAVLETDFEDEHKNHSIVISPDIDKSNFFKLIGIEETKKIFSAGVTYFTHSFGIRPDTFKKNQNLVDNFYIIGTSKTDKGIEFVSTIEHKKYPFLANQWHPEKNQFERGSLYSFLDRSIDSVSYMHKMIAVWVNEIRLKGTPKNAEQVDEELLQYFSIFRPSEIPPLTTYERIYTFQRFHSLE